MTDLEKKAEEYLENKSNWKNGETCVQSIRQAYKYGYKQGQKIDCSQCENTSILQEQVEYFRKENKELKAQTEEQAKEISDLRNTLCSALKTIKENKDKWKYLEGRFVEMNECTEESKKKCLMYEDMRCDGTACRQFIDMVALLEKACEGDINGIR